MAKASKYRGPPNGGDLIAVIKAQGRRSDELDVHTGKLFRAGAKSCPHIAAIRRIKVSPGVADEARRGRPAAATQHLMGAEPGLRVFFVRIRGKPWIWREIVSSPFPDIANHLSTAKGTVAGAMGADLDDSILPV